MDNPLGYPPEVWRLFRETPRAGRLAGGLHGEAGTAANRSRIRLDARTAGERVADTRFSALGCPFTIATAAWLAQWLVGRTADDLDRPPVTELRAALEIPEDRAHCWLMAQDVLRDLRRQWS